MKQDDDEKNWDRRGFLHAVAAGSTVTWTNRDDVPHNIVNTNQTFKSPVLGTDERFSHIFTSPGTCTYFCSIHPRMTGQVVVG